MSDYDSADATFDSGLTYDSDSPAPSPVLEPMAKVKQNMKGLTDLQTIQQCLFIKKALTGNADFTTPTRTLTAFGTLITTAQTSLTAMDNAVSEAKEATVDKDNAMAALLGGVDHLATYVQLTSGGLKGKKSSQPVSRCGRIAPRRACPRRC